MKREHNHASDILASIRNSFLGEKTGTKCDALFITKPENIAYITGFRGTAGSLIISKKHAVLMSDARYSGSARFLVRNTPIEYLEIDKNDDFFSKISRKLHLKKIGFESSHVTVSRFRHFKKVFGSHITFIRQPGIVEEERKKKRADEIDLIEASARITDRALEVAVGHLKKGVSEKEIAWIFEKSAREEFSADGVSFPPIVAFGKNSAVPHHETTDTKLSENSPVLIDCGVFYRHYASDISRSLFFGKPTVKWREMYALAHKAQQAGMAALIPGTKCSSADSEARKVLGKLEKYFTHSFGHGVGLEIHESPTISSLSKDSFAEHMAVTAEPGLYFPGEFGIRIEDLLLVEEKGTRFLSHFPYFQAT